MGLRVTIVCTALLVLLPGCRKDAPPQLSIICTLDGHGGGDCVTGDGQKKYLSPSEMTNYWATSQADEANFTAWCYKTSVANAEAQMRVIEAQIYSTSSAEIAHR